MSWEAPVRRLTIWGGSSPLAKLVVAFVTTNAMALSWAPADASPPFALAAWIAALALGPLVLVRRWRVGLGAWAAFSGAMGTLGTANAYLWLGR